MKRERERCLAHLSNNTTKVAETTTLGNLRNPKPQEEECTTDSQKVIAAWSKMGYCLVRVTNFNFSHIPCSPIYSVLETIYDQT